MKFLEEDERRFNFQNLFSKEYLVPALIMIVIIQNFCLLFSKGSEFITVSNESNKPPLSNFCSLFGDQLLAKKINPKLVEASVYDILTASDYSILEFKGKEKLLGTMASNDQCLTFIRDDLSVRTISFQVTESSSNKAYYQVISVKEED